MEDPKTQHIDIELSEEIAQGTYSNLVVISHSPSEFVLDFIRVMPGVTKPKVKSRIVMTPEHAKRFMSALMDNITRFEASFGPIKNTPTLANDMPNFGGPKAQA